MNKAKNVIDYYVLCNKLKNVIRTGWKNWNVSADRVESVAEHIYGTQMLAIAMYHEYNYDLDIYKVLYMLAIHELGETIIGDLTQFEISKTEKEKIEHDAVHNILSNLLDGNVIEKLYIEFDEHITKESIFAYLCDKLECDIQCKLYDEKQYVDLNNQDKNSTYNNESVKKYLEEGNSWSSMWLKFGREKYPYDEFFTEVSKYVEENNISK